MVLFLSLFITTDPSGESEIKFELNGSELLSVPCGFKVYSPAAWCCIYTSQDVFFLFFFLILNLK